MRKERFISDFVIYDDENEIPSKDAELLREAHQAARNSYAPYSQFHVGAAVRLSNGAIVTGNNIENAAYPSGLCAERVAIFRAQAQYPQVPFEAIAITAYSDKTEVNEPIAPCGACRQVMVEIEKIYQRPLRILCQGDTGSIMAFDGIETLMPFIFVDKFL